MRETFFPRIKKEEYFSLFNSFIFFFFVLASWYALRPVRNEMAVAGGVYNLPLLLTAVMFVMLLANPIYSWVVSKVQSSKVVTYCYLFTAYSYGGHFGSVPRRYGDDFLIQWEHF